MRKSFCGTLRRKHEMVRIDTRVILRDGLECGIHERGVLYVSGTAAQLREIADAWDANEAEKARKAQNGRNGRQ